MSYRDSGAYACVYVPAKNCKDGKRQHVHTVGKVFSKQKHLNEEDAIATRINNIDPMERFTVKSYGTCDIITFSNAKCEHDLKHSNKQLIYRYGGYPVSKVLKTSKDFNVFFKNLLPVLVGIQKLIEKNIVHQDLKPANILINDKNKISIIDFGLMTNKVYDDENIHILRHTYPWYPPEFKFYTSSSPSFESIYVRFKRNFSAKDWDSLKHTVPNLKKALNEAYLNPTYDQKKVDIYSLGVVLMQMYFKCHVRNMFVLGLIGRMVDPDTRYRYDIKTLLTDYKKVISYVP